MARSRRGPTWAAVALVLLAACSRSADPFAAPSVAPLEPYAPPASGPVARVAVDGVLDHLQALQAIADESGGTRTVGSPGYEASVEYVTDVLEATGYDVERPTTSVPVFHQDGRAVLDRIEPSPVVWTDGRDFRPMLFSASGDVRAHVTAIDGGCELDDFGAFPTGDVALVEPDERCFRRRQVQNAESADASAVIGVSLAPPGHPLRPTLITPDGIDVPVLSVTSDLGPELEGATVHVRVRASTSFADVESVIAQPAGAPASHVVMLGAHLDSVIDGPGIDDDGSGVALLLETARWLASMDPAPAVRFAFWAGEEEGLYGSWAYAHALSAEERDAIEIYLNLDMVASPNFVTFVYDATADDPPESRRVADLLEDALADLGAPSERLDLHGASDHAAFEDVGVATGGLYSGSQERKTPAQASAFGGEAGRPLDPCYHQACDTLENVGRDALRIHALALVAVLERLLRLAPA